jgi:hypothetical protein
MIRHEILYEINRIINRYPVNKNSRLCRLWRKSHRLNDRKLNNLLKGYRLHKMINSVK